jgi:hypothetical protein
MKKRALIFGVSGQDIGISRTIELLKNSNQKSIF